MSQPSLIPKVEILSGVPEGLDALILGKLAAVVAAPQLLSASGGAGQTPAKTAPTITKGPGPGSAPEGQPLAEQPVLMHIARDDRRLETLASSLAFFAPHVRVVTIPAWDCVPYDRVSPDAEIVAKRLSSLAVC